MLPNKTSMRAHALAPIAAIGFGLAAPACQAASFAKLADFSLTPGAANPTTGLVPSGSGLVGVSHAGGAYGLGAIYALKPGQGSIVDQVKILHSFSYNINTPPFDLAGASGEIDVDAGILYGVGNGNSIIAEPAIYQFDLASGAEMLLARFNDTETITNGVFKSGNLLYGTVQKDSSHPAGTLFSVDPSTTVITTLYVFGGNADGGTPLAALTALGGKLYGTTSQGGAKGGGTIFAFDPATGALATLYNFDPATEGASSAARLIVASGVLFGTTSTGGPASGGTIFRFDPHSGTTTVLHALGATGDGAFPAAALLYAHDQLYGTTSAGGRSGKGTVFALDLTTGRETLLHSFAGADGADPQAPLRTVRGSLYGTTYLGGAFNAGALFRINP